MKTFKLRTKAVVIVSIVCVCFIIVDIFISLILLGRAVELEKRDLDTKILSATNIIFENLSSLNDIASDWGYWDETYDFMADQNEEYILNNYNRETIKNLKINLIVLVDVNGKIVYKNALDYTNNEEIDFPEDINRYLTKDKMLIPDDQTREKNGLVVLDGVPVLFSSRAILNSEFKGPSRGTLIFGRYLIYPEVARLGNIIKQKIELQTLDSPGVSLEESEIIQKLAANPTGTEYLTYREPYSNENRIKVYKLLSNYWGESSVLLSVDQSRTIYLTGRQTIQYFSLSFLLGGLLTVFLLLWFSDRLVISRILLLSKSILKIGEDNNFEREISIGGNDELTDVANSVNSMLKKLDQTTRDIRESEGKFRQVTENIREVFFLQDIATGKVIYISPMVEEVWGISQETLYGKPLSIFKAIHEEDRNWIRDSVLRLKENSYQFNEEFRIRRADGGIRWAWARSFPVYNEEGVIHRLAGIAEDITERKIAEENLRENEEKFRSVLTQANDGIILVDNKGIVIEWSHGEEIITGIKRDDAIGMYIWELYMRMTHNSVIKGTQSYIALQEDILKFLKSGKADWANKSIEYEIYHQDGTQKIIQEITFPITTAGGYLSGSVIRDITEQRKQQREVASIAQMGVALRSQISRQDIVSAVLEQIKEILVSQGSFLGRVNSETNTIDILSGCGDWHHLTGRKLPPNQPVLNRVLATAKPAVISPQDENLWLKDMGIESKAILCVPLIVQGETIGAVGVGRNSPYLDVDVQILNSLGDLAANAIHRGELFEQTQDRVRTLTAIRAVEKAISSSLELQSIFEILLSQVVSILKVDAADLLIYQPMGQILRYAYGQGFRTSFIQHSRLTLQDGVGGRVALERKRIFIADLTNEKNFRRAPLLRDEDFVSYIGLPLISKGELKGVLELFQRTKMEPERNWLELLDALTGQAAIAIGQAELFESLQTSNMELVQAYDATIAGWARALELRDRETEGHSKRVVEMTLNLAEKFNFNQSDMINLRRGALLHDIGKMGIPDEVLNKPGPLTTEEWEIMRQHPVYAYDLLINIPFLKHAVDIPFGHHEKWDGSGYPRGIKGDNIPLAARLFAVVDVWDALTSDRPYRRAWSREKTMEYLRAESGRHFDPKVVEVFLQLIQEPQDMQDSD